MTRRALAHCRLQSGSVVLDVGCGRGATVAYLRHRHNLAAYGLDCSSALLNIARTQCAGAPFVRGRAEQLPLAAGSTAALFCECALSLTDQPALAVKEFYRVLAEGGWLVLSDLFSRSGVEAAVQPRHPVIHCCLSGAMTRRGIEALVTQAGFAIRTWEDHTALLKHFAAQLVLEFGSLEAFWKTTGGAQYGPVCHCDGNARPGYYLLVARKE